MWHRRVWRIFRKKWRWPTLSPAKSQCQLCARLVGHCERPSMNPWTSSSKSTSQRRIAQLCCLQSRWGEGLPSLKIPFDEGRDSIYGVVTHLQILPTHVVVEGPHNRSVYTRTGPEQRFGNIGRPAWCSCVRARDEACRFRQDYPTMKHYLFLSMIPLNCHPIQAILEDSLKRVCSCLHQEKGEGGR